VVFWGAIAAAPRYDLIMSAPLRILLVASSLDDDGGLPVCVGQLASALAERGHAVEITGQYENALSPVIAAAGRRDRVSITGFQRPWTLLGQVAAARATGRLVSDRAAAAVGGRLIVHTQGAWVLAVIAAGIAARIAGVPHVVTLHGMLRREAMQKSRWKKRLVLAAAVRRQLVDAEAVHVTSTAEADDLRKLISGLRPVIIPIGIVPPPIGNALASRVEPRTAGYLGRLLPIKNLEALLGAWQNAAAPEWRLRIAGPGEPAFAEQLKQLAATLGLADRVTIEPAIPYSSLGDFFARLDLFILPSKSESFGMAAGEALAAGVPAIVTAEAPWQGVEQLGCGWSVEPTAAGLAHAIREATARSGAELHAMGQRGARWVRSEYSWPAIAQRVVGELYGG
jgi:glycosyltransferase involved in cell wall biosynthesis